VAKISQLLNLVGELVINKIHSTEKINALRRLMKNSRTVHRKFQDTGNILLNHPEIQQITLFKNLKTGLQDMTQELMQLREEAATLYKNISTEVSHVDPIIDALQLRMKQIRMLPVSSVFEIMPRLVRDIAVTQGKEITLLISGEETELDKKVLETIKGALIHLLRNSVDHGIELPEERAKIGKKTQGIIAIRAYHKGDHVIIEVEDDGRGMSLEAIKKTAILKGFATSEELQNLSEQEILRFIFYPGFSTASIITDISGRGVGLNVVKTDIENLKGSILVKTELGKGTLFTLRISLTVAITQALLVRVEDEIFAIPLLSVQESLWIPKSKIFSIENRPLIRLRDRTIALASLKNLLNVPVTDTPIGIKNTENACVVILNSLEKFLGIQVDAILGEQEIFIKSLDPNLGKLKNVSGATVLGSGQGIVILDVMDLFESCKESAALTPSALVDTPVPKQKKRILIVEDSLTTRELECSILEAHGYEVDTAIDGLDALNKVQSQPYDLVLSDLDMPRLEGFELCKRIRENPDLKDLKVVIVTSLSREEDKRRGIEVGAHAYIVKSTFDQASLIDTVKRLVG
jgi:two-component system chemotaxis sensor kinase CheA